MEPLIAGIIGFVLGIVVAAGVALLIGGLGEFGLMEVVELFG